MTSKLDRLRPEHILLLMSLICTGLVASVYVFQYSVDYALERQVAP